MKQRSFVNAILGGAALAALLTAGCGGNQPQVAPPKPPEVLVSYPITRVVTSTEEFTGRTEAVNSVEVRARVTGYLDKAHFTEGVRVEVKQGQLLFQIDPRPYQAELARAEASVIQSTAHLTRLEDDLTRARDLLPRKAISREEFDKISGDRAEAAAAVKVSEAARDFAKLNLDFTQVKAPISGRISRQFIDPGNLVKADETILTSIVQDNPMYVYFDIDERTVMRAMIREGRIKSAAEVKTTVGIGFTDEQGFPDQGVIDFVENRVDSGSGTLRVRVVFDNPKRLVSPGQFSRIRLPVGSPKESLLVAEQALGIDQGQRFVYVVGPDAVAKYRRVRIGSLHDGQRVIEDGLRPDERIIVSGLQRVRAGVKVEARVTPMPAGPPGSTAAVVTSQPDDKQAPKK
jgi:RND family efflux transporter MFP subunit